MGQHVTRDSLHPFEVFHIQFQDEFFSGMGDHSAITIHHKGIARLAQLGPGNLFHKKVDLQDSGDTPDKLPAFSRNRNTDRHYRIAGQFGFDHGPNVRLAFFGSLEIVAVRNIDPFVFSIAPICEDHSLCVNYNYCLILTANLLHHIGQVST